MSDPGAGLDSGELEAATLLAQEIMRVTNKGLSLDPTGNFVGLAYAIAFAAMTRVSPAIADLVIQTITMTVDKQKRRDAKIARNKPR